MAERYPEPTGPSVVVSASLQLAIAVGGLLLTRYALNEYAAPGNLPAGPPPSLAPTLLLAGFTMLCVLSSIALLLRCRWARWPLALSGLPLLFLAGNPLKTLQLFIFLGGAFFALPFLVAIAVVAAGMYAFGVAGRFRGRAA